MTQNSLRQISKSIRAYPIGSVLTILSAIGILWCLIRMSRPLQTWDFSRDDLLLPGEGLSFEAGTIAGNDPGWYVDNSMAYGEIFVQTPPFNLPMGSYEFQLSYQTDEDGSTYSFDSTDSNYRVMLGRTGEKLDIGKRKKILTNNYYMDEDDFYIKIRYGGNGYLIVNQIAIRQTRALERVICTVILFCLGLYFVLRKLQEAGKLSGFLVAATVALAVQIPYLGMYLYPGDDLGFHLLRIQGIADGLRCGQFPVRIQPTWMNGYGYAVSIFYSDAVLFFAGLLRLIGFSLQASYKIYVYAISFFTFVIAKYSFQRIFKDSFIATVGSALYTLAPYRLLNIFCRAGIGEFTALTFLPLIFIGFYEIFTSDRRNGKNSWLMLTLGMTGILQSHILTSEIVILFAAVSCLLFIKKLLVKERLIQLSKAIAATVLLNAWFLYPFLDYYFHDVFYVNSGSFGRGPQTTGVFLSQLLEIFPRYSTQILSIADGVWETERSFAIGIAFIIVLIIFILLCIRDPQTKKKPEMQMGRFCSVSGTILLFMSTVWFPWDFLCRHSRILNSLIPIFQFPWRLLGVATLLFSVLVCTVLTYWKKQYEKYYFHGLAALLLLLSEMTCGSFASSILDYSPALLAPDCEAYGTFIVGGYEYIPTGVIVSPSQMPENTLLHSDSLIAESFEKNGTNCIITLQNTSSESQSIELPMLYYRGYLAKDSQTGDRIALSRGDNGRSKLTVAGGYSGSVRVSFREPFFWRIAEIISLCTALLMGIHFRKRRKKNVF